MIPRLTRRIWQAISEGHRPLVVLISLGLLVGVLIGRDYGLSVDEERNAGLGEMALQAFTGNTLYFDQPSLDEHGPAYFMFFAETSKWVNETFSGWRISDGRHLTNYVMFLLATASLYFLSLRIVSRLAALLATALFATQPLVFGQAFINQKDIPFMALVLASLTVGLAAWDRMTRSLDLPGEWSEGGTWRDRWRSLREEWLAYQPRARLVLGVGLGAGLLVFIDLIAGGAIRSLAEGIVASAYAGHAPSLIQVAFDKIATDAYKTPLSLYMGKLAVAWFVVRAAAALGLALFAWVMLNLLFPASAQAWGWSWHEAWPMRWGWWVGLAAILLGLTICVRQIGVFFGALVSLYALYRLRVRALGPLLVFWGVAFAVTVITWPYLWPNPIVRFISSLYLSANFPDTHVTFYRGAWLRAGTYPWYFFPNLAGIELTESALGLILVGLVLGVRRLFRQWADMPLILILGAWFGVPLVGLIFFHMTTYGNITHLLFILPAFFVFAGLAVDWLLGLLRPWWSRGGLAVLCLAPGIWGIVGLHPYEYIYFNSFTGGVSGAANYYEMDRWCLSIREAIEDVDLLAPPGSTVMLPSSFDQAIPFARPDIRLIDDRTSYDQAQFVIQCTWVHGLRPWPEQEFTRIGDVRRGQAVLATIWRRTSLP